LTRQRLNAQEAAETLGISVDAVRMRARRKTLDSEHENGRLYVWLDTDSSNVHPQREVEALLQEKNERIEELREQLHHFRGMLAEERDARRRADTIIVQLTQANAALAHRVPELEATSSSGRQEAAEPAAPSEPEREQPDREAPERVVPHKVEPEMEESERAQPRPPDTGGAQEGAGRVSWWRRMFGR
jgi:hypothetical protein